MSAVSTAGPAECPQSRAPRSGDWAQTWDLHCSFLVASGKPPSRLSLPEKGHAFLGTQIPEPRGIFVVTPEWNEPIPSPPSVRGVKREGDALTVKSLSVGNGPAVLPGSQLPHLPCERMWPSHFSRGEIPISSKDPTWKPSTYHRRGSLCAHLPGLLPSSVRGLCGLSLGTPPFPQAQDGNRPSWP